MTSSVFQGTFEHAVDSKRRLQVPARWRPSEGGSEVSVVPWGSKVAGKYLRVFSADKMLEILKKLDALPETDPAKGSMKRILGGGSETMTLDSSGRGCLPEKLAAEAGITNKAVFVGCLDHWEIWAPDRHAQMKEADSVLSSNAYQYLE